MSNLGPIFETMSHDDGMVAVSVEWAQRGNVIIARDYADRVVMGLPVAHASKAILSTMFDSVDADAILARIAEGKTMSEHTTTECRNCGAEIVLTNGEWHDVNGGPDGIPTECTMAPRPNYGPHVPLTD